MTLQFILCRLLCLNCLHLPFVGPFLSPLIFPIKLAFKVQFAHILSNKTSQFIQYHFKIPSSCIS